MISRSSDRSRIAHKHLRLDLAKIKRAQRLLKADTETETLEKALDVVIAEHERNRLARKANERFLKSGIQIRDVYGKLAEPRTGQRRVE
jgi:hypothetical protein